MTISIRRVLIANRGEIAARVAKTCRRLGVEFVAVYSDADAQAPYLREAITTVPLGNPLAVDSYLNADKVIAAALATGCDAIHPGYGFLSENSRFAAAVAQAGLIFIGPSPDTIESLGDKARAKALMQSAGVPTVPGTSEASEDLGRIAQLADAAGYPVLLKPTAGGGGKGMQIVRSSEALPEAAAQAIRLGRANFTDGRLLVERYIERPRHIEVQVFGDAHGNAVHLFERECSLQRRHQKVVEEAPAQGLAPATRAALLEAAVRGALAVGYLNAGTFEFIVDAAGDFFFLEVNTRLQVEHPVTEEITGIDLVEWQLRVAAGETLPLRQEEITAKGHAIECRVYAEDPAREFSPCAGRIAHLVWPASARVETGVRAGLEISTYYDPMIAKIVVHAADRARAIESMLVAMAQTAVLGLTTNVGFLIRVLSDEAVRRNEIHTRYLDDHLERLIASVSLPPAMACAVALCFQSDLADDSAQTSPRWPWSANSATGLLDRAALGSDTGLGSMVLWAGSEAQPAVIVQAQAQARARDNADAADSMTIRCLGHTAVLSIARGEDGLWRGAIDGAPWIGALAGNTIDLQVAGHHFTLQRYGARSPAMASGAGIAAAPMPGVVVAIPVAVGDIVTAGTTLAIVEAMKTENRVLAGCDGTVAAIHCKVGDSTRAGDILVEVQS